MLAVSAILIRMKKKAVTIRISESKHNQMKRLSRQDHRTVEYHYEKAIALYLAQQRATA